MEDKLFERFEFGTELLWISLYFLQPNAITQESMDRDACQVYINSLDIKRLTRTLHSVLWDCYSTCKVLNLQCHQPEFLWTLKTFRQMYWVRRLVGEDKRRKTLLKTIEEGGEGGGISFFMLWKKILDEVAFNFIRNLFSPQRAVFYFLWTFWMMRAVISTCKLIWNGLIPIFQIK